MKVDGSRLFSVPGSKPKSAGITGKDSESPVDSLADTVSERVE